MPLVPAKCTQCGAALDVDSTQEAAVCPHCKTPFITEKAINNYNTTNVTNIGSLHADVVQLSDERSIDNRVKSGETFIRLDEFGKAHEVFRALIAECPYDYRSWFGMIRVLTTGFTNYDISKAQLENIKSHYDKAHKVADEEGKKAMGDICDKYINAVQSKLTQLANTTSVNIQNTIQSNNQAINALNAQIEELSNKRENARTLTTTIKVIFTIAGIITTFVLFGSASILYGIVSAGIFGIVGYILYNILDSVYDDTCSELNRQIDFKRRDIAVQNSHFNNNMAQLNQLMEKATASTTSN